MKYYPTVYRSFADLAAAMHGDYMVRDADGYLVRAPFQPLPFRSEKDVKIKTTQLPSPSFSADRHDDAA